MLLGLAMFMATTNAQEIKPTTPHDVQQSSATDPTPATSDQSDRQLLEARLAEKLTGTRWQGRFTVIGDDEKLTEETYEITRATKTPEGDYWLLVARIKYGQNDMTLPLPPIEIKWAGSTPVITLDQLTIPGLGTFDARVLIRGDRYSGTWSHNDKGGHLFGTIEKLAKPEEE